VLPLHADRGALIVMAVLLRLRGLSFPSRMLSTAGDLAGGWARSARWSAPERTASKRGEEADSTRIFHQVGPDCWITSYVGKRFLYISANPVWIVGLRARWRPSCGHFSSGQPEGYPSLATFGCAHVRLANSPRYWRSRPSANWLATRLAIIARPDEISGSKPG